MENLAIERLYIKKVDLLPSGERVALKRACGVTLDQAPGNAFQAFFKCVPEMVASEDLDKWFAAACFRCLWKEEQRNAIHFESALRQLSENGFTSIGKRIMTLLDCPWDSDGFLCGKMTRLMKMVMQKGYVVDIPSLLNDLCYWNNPSRMVQKKWVRTFYASKIDKE